MPMAGRLIRPMAGHDARAPWPASTPESKAAMPVWTAINLGNCRTEFLESLDLARAPVATARAIRAELADRRNER